MTDFIGPLITMLIPIIIVIFAVLYLTKMFKDLTKGLGPKPKAFSPQTTGERLKKCIIIASKANPCKCKYLKLRRTKYNEGGVVGYILGVVVTGDCTRIVFRTTRFVGFRKVLYVPQHMHGSLHHKEVFLDGISIENVSGFFFIIPYDQTNIMPYQISYNAFKKDLKKMQRMDTQQIEIEQIISAMIGEEAQEEIIRAPEDLPISDAGDEQFA